ncbi:MAG: glycosyltransferase [Clostridia bacterium]|nr:glycosyltransferase [Clostridia bacterium]
MSDRPLISVLMGAYNCASTLEEAVDCIINQTYTNWELIICDDNSTDNTYEVLCSLAKKDSRIVILKNDKNLTLAPTLNRCLEVARGEYIARMDGDDVCSLVRFEKELDFLEANPEYALVSCHMEVYDENGVFGVIKHKPVPTLKDFLKRSQFCHAGCMMRTEVLRTLGGYSESDKFTRVEDYELWVRMYLAGYIGYNLQEVLYSMRDDRNALRRRTLKNRLNESRVIMKVCKEGKLSIFARFRALVPIIKWLVPSFVYKMIHNKKNK